MKIPFYYILIFQLLFISSLQSQNSKVSGHIVNTDDESIIGAHITLLQEDSTQMNIGTVSDLDGFYLLEDIPQGNYLLQVSYLGYNTIIQKLHINAPALKTGRIHLSPAAASIGEITVSEMNTPASAPTEIAPTVATKYIVKPETLFEITAPQNLIDAITLVNGVQEEIACGVCFTNSISINGLPGQYTAVLVDGTPMYGNLSSVYGLNGIPTTMIDRIEITKGPSSTIFGSEAVAGVINIITKDPIKEPLISLDLMGTSHLETFNNLSIAGTLGKFSGMLGASYVYVGKFEDNNQDQFGDIVNMDRLSVFAKIKMNRPQNRRFTLFAKYYYEDRRNGVEAYLKNRAYKNLRGSDIIYGESIYTQRFEVLGTYDLPTAEYFKLDYSFSGHYQDSYYGSDHYLASQYIGFTNFNWNKYIKGHGITAGLTLRYQYYDDNTVATQDSAGQNIPEHQFIPGLFIQDAWDISQKVSLLYGCRLDYYQNHGFIPAPRFNIKYNPDKWTTFRFNFGTGFRIVNLFTEDHAFITGNRTVEIAEALQPERSYNASLNFNHVFSLGMSQGNINIEGFYTYFTNAIFPDYSINNKIVYKNLNGFAQTRGFSVGYNHQFHFPLSIALNYNMQWADQTERHDDGSTSKSNIEFSPLFSGSLVLNYRITPWQLNISYTGRLVGSMTLPEVFDVDDNGQLVATARPTTSKPYSLHSIQITKKFKKLNLSIYAGVQNLLNYRQVESPMVGYNDPAAPPGFSDYFDTAYAYSPIHGREFYLGIRWQFRPKSKH